MTDRAPASEPLFPTPSNHGVDAAVMAARRVMAALLLAGDGTDLAMDDIAALLDRVADQLEERAPAAAERLVDMWAGEGITSHDPVTGSENAVAPPLQLSGRSDGSVAATVRLGLLYQGPPGCVHGGISALLLDHTLGVANAWAGTSGMTGTLTIRYRRPVPLFEELTITGRQTGVTGRRISTVGTIEQGCEVLVEAEAIFVDKRLPRPR